MSLLSMCRTTVTLERQEITKDAAGGEIKVWEPVVEDIPADVQPSSAHTVLAYMQQQIHVSHTIYLTQDVGARKTDRFTSSGRVFLIRGYRPGAPGYNQWPAIADVQEVLTS